MDRFQILAMVHLQRNPSEARNLDQLEAHYRGLAMGSPFGGAVLAIKEQEAASSAVFETRIALANARRVSAGMPY